MDYGVSLWESNSGIKDHTPDNFVTNLLNFPLTLRRGLAIDKDDPKNPSVKAWQLACSFYPHELSELNEVLSFEERLTNAKNIRFLKNNLLDLPLPT